MVDETDAIFSDGNLKWATEADLEAQLMPSKSVSIKLYKLKEESLNLNPLLE